MMSWTRRWWWRPLRQTPKWMVDAAPAAAAEQAPPAPPPPPAVAPQLPAAPPPRLRREGALAQLMAPLLAATNELSQEAARRGTPQASEARLRSAAAGVHILLSVVSVDCANAALHDVRAAEAQMRARRPGELTEDDRETVRKANASAAQHQQRGSAPGRRGGAARRQHNNMRHNGPSPLREEDSSVAPPPAAPADRARRFLIRPLPHAIAGYPRFQGAPAPGLRGDAAGDRAGRERPEAGGPGGADARAGGARGRAAVRGDAAPQEDGGGRAGAAGARAPRGARRCRCSQRAGRAAGAQGGRDGALESCCSMLRCRGEQGRPS